MNPIEALVSRCSAPGPCAWPFGGGTGGNRQFDVFTSAVVGRSVSGDPAACWPEERRPSDGPSDRSRRADRRPPPVRRRSAAPVCRRSAARSGPELPAVSRQSPLCRSAPLSSGDAQRRILGNVLHEPPADAEGDRRRHGEPGSHPERERDERERRWTGDDVRSKGGDLHDECVQIPRQVVQRLTPLVDLRRRRPDRSRGSICPIGRLRERVRERQEWPRSESIVPSSESIAPACVAE